MSNVLTIQRIDNTQGSLRVRGTVVLSGSYVQKGGGGEVLNFANAVFAMGNSGNAANVLPVSKGPISFDMWGCNGYSYGTFQALGNAALTVPIVITTTSNTELAAGAYPSTGLGGVTGDNIQFEAVFDSLL